LVTLFEDPAQAGQRDNFQMAEQMKYPSRRPTGVLHGRRELLALDIPPWYEYDVVT
jgi:hypothetical protein